MSDATITFPILGEGFKLDFLPYFTIFGWRFYWYGAIIAVGFLLAVLYCLKRSKQFGYTQDKRYRHADYHSPTRDYLHPPFLCHILP
jgi:hypothetical protein